MGAMGGGSPSASRARVRGIHSGEARGAIAKKALAPTSEPLPTALPIFTDFYRLLPIFTDFSDFLGKTIGNIGNIG